MSRNISESAFETAIEAALIGSPDARPHPRSIARLRHGRLCARRLSQAEQRRLRPRPLPHRRRPAGLHPGHPARHLETAHPALRRPDRASASSPVVSREITRRGTLDVLRKGVKDAGCKFDLAYFRPASGLNDESRRKYEANQFSVVRQLHYSEQNENSLDLALFLNGLPIFTAELKNDLTGQTVYDAIKQYKQDRDPREPLLSPGRCLAHFAVDPNLVYVTSKLDRDEYPLPALQPGQVRRRRQPARAAHPAGQIPHQLSVGRDLVSRQRAQPDPPVHPRSADGGRKGQQDGRDLHPLPPLPAAGHRAQSWSPTPRSTAPAGAT